MEAVIFCGIQGSGKSAFYRRRFFQTHVRINLDMLRTRRREEILLSACLRAGQRFVVDNTNPTAGERRRYVQPARRAGFRVVGYFFELAASEAVARNAARPADERVPPPAIYGTRKRLQPPRPEEGFDALFRVHASGDDRFELEPLAAT